MAKLTFYGAAKNVTGSNFLLETKTTRMIVDCGLFQGKRYCESENFPSFPYNPASIDAVAATHAHIDHTARIPKLYKEGFRGPIYSTPPTKDFAEHMLLDSENVITQQAEEQGCAPMYSTQEVAETLDLWQKIPYRTPVSLKQCSLEFFDAGHVLGSSFIVVTAEDGTRIAFSGDLGNSPAPLIKTTDPLPEADYLVMESTYGNRLHEDPVQKENILKQAIKDIVKSKGVLMIPAFALERTQQMLYVLNNLVESGEIPQIPVFLDSPLAIKLTTIYTKYSHSMEYFDKEARAQIADGDNLFDFPGLKTTLTRSQSLDINDVPPPKIVIAGSGMMNGGRILHHALRYLQDPNSILLIVGFQARGTLGREILQGAKEVEIFENTVIPVRAQIREIEGYSAHADKEGLLDWIRPRAKSLKGIFLVHGEEDQMEPLKETIERELDVKTHIPSQGETVSLPSIDKPRTIRQAGRDARRVSRQ